MKYLKLLSLENTLLYSQVLGIICEWLDKKVLPLSLIVARLFLDECMPRYCIVLRGHPIIFLRHKLHMRYSQWLRSCVPHTKPGLDKNGDATRDE